jgi:hypothetical protein
MMLPQTKASGFLLQQADDLPSKDVSWGACYGRSLGIKPDISQKHKMGDISQGVANTLWNAPKKYSDYF